MTDYNETRQAISQETADQLCKILTNSTKNVSVNGYNIISKTGTTQKIDQPKREETGNYWMISSCISFAPAEDPQIAILIVIDEPTGEKFFVVLYTDGAEAEPTVSVPSFAGMTPQQVLSVASTYGLNVELKGIHKDDYSCHASTQSIEPGTMVTTGTIVSVQFIYNESIE